MKKFIKDS